ncbi:MAG: hypothetical protein LBB75_03165 [Oscillospiraceae bacterium]|nr:hypothetical protein [Oscillospiraceae bacterium]
MAKLLKSVLALGLAALLLFACAACNTKEPEPTAPEATDEITTTEPESLDVVATSEEDTSEEPTTVDGTTAEAPSTAPGGTTTAAPTTVPAKPATKAEIVAYYNAAVKKVKADKPGYVMNDRVHIDGERIWISSKLLDAIAPGIINLAKGTWSNWSEDRVTAKGDSHNGFPPSADIQDAWIKSATCNESGNSYQIRLNLVDERVAALPTDNKGTIHGKVMDNGVWTTGAIKDGAAEVGVNISKWDSQYSGSYINATINKTTGAMVTVYYYVDCLASVTVKVPVIPVQDATVPLATESRYTF